MGVDVYLTLVPGVTNRDILGVSKDSERLARRWEITTRRAQQVWYSN